MLVDDREPHGPQVVDADLLRYLARQRDRVGDGEGRAAARNAAVALATGQTLLFADADMIIKVKEPIAVEWPRMRPGLVMYTYFHFAADEPLTRAVMKSGAIAVAYETVQLPGGQGTTSGGQREFIAPLARATGSLPNTLSANLNILSRAGLIASRRDGRSIIYSAAFEPMSALLAFLVEDCCNGDGAVCEPLADIASRAACCAAGQSVDQGETV